MKSIAVLVLASLLLAGCACSTCSKKSTVKQNAEKAFSDVDAQQIR